MAPSSVRVSHCRVAVSAPVANGYANHSCWALRRRAEKKNTRSVLERAVHVALRTLI